MEIPPSAPSAGGLDKQGGKVNLAQGLMHICKLDLIVGPMIVEKGWTLFKAWVCDRKFVAPISVPIPNARLSTGLSFGLERNAVLKKTA